MKVFINDSGDTRRDWRVASTIARLAANDLREFGFRNGADSWAIPDAELEGFAIGHDSDGLRTCVATFRFLGESHSAEVAFSPFDVLCREHKYSAALREGLRDSWCRAGMALAA